MRKIFSFLALFSLLGNVYSQTQTITTLAPIQTSYCSGGNIIVSYETTGTFNFGTTFTAQLSDLWGDFSNPVDIGSVPVNTGLIPATIPVSTSFGVNYRVRVVTDNPYIEGSVSPLPPIVITNAAISATVLVSPNDTACFGDSITLSSNLNESYVWSTGETTSSITVTESGSYKVTVTNYFTGCEVTSDEKIITFNPPPPVNIGNDTAICDGDVLILDAGTGFVSYKWNDILTFSNEYYVHHAGVIYVEVTDTNYCKNSDTISIIVNQNPVVNLGNDTSFCGNVYFIDAGSGFIAYNWNNGLSYNQILQLNQPGLYHVLVTDSNLCKAVDTVEINIMHTPFLSLGNDLSVCGNNITLDAGSGYEIYDWNDGAANTQYYTITQSGTYFVLIVDSNGCKVSDTINVAINAVPQLYIGNDFTVGNNQTIVLNAGNNAEQYLWSNGSSNPILVLHSSELGEGVFVYWVTVFDDNGCSNTDSITITVDFSNAVNEIESSSFKNVFPNPFSEKAYITCPNPDGNPASLNLKVYDVLGRECFFSHSTFNDNIIIDAINQNNGMYTYILLKENNIIQKGRFIVNK